MQYKMSKAKLETNSSAHIKSTLAAGALEVLFFHPSDTVQKRLMKNPKPIYDFNKVFNENMRNAFNVAFTDPKTNRFSVYPGLAWASGYKLLQRGYKFGGQPILEKRLQENYFGNANKFWAAGTSGAIMGAGEVIFLPLDIFKIRNQTGSTDSGISFRGLPVTMLRNIIGSSALFGVPVLVQNVYFKGEKLNRTQKISTQALGAIASLILSNPLDVIKTRLQANANSAGAFATAVSIAQNNPSQFFKSLAPKLLTQGLKLTFFMAVKDKIEEQFNQPLSLSK